MIPYIHPSLALALPLAAAITFAAVVDVTRRVKKLTSRKLAMRQARR